MGYYLRLEASDARPLAGRLFLKELARVGRWVHPKYGYPVEFSREKLAKVAASTTGWIEAKGGRIPVPNGHRFDATSNLGFGHRVYVDGDKLYGVVEAADDEIAKGFGTRMRDVSIYLEDEAVDSQGRKHQDVITHIAVTQYPVITGQENFVALSCDGAVVVQVPVFLPATATDAARDVRGEPPGGKRPMKKILSALGLGEDATEEQAVEALAKRAAPAGDVKAFEARATAAEGKATALEARATALEADLKGFKDREAARDKAEIDGLVSSAKKMSLASTPLAAEDEQDARDLWASGKKDAAKRVLERAVKASGAGAVDLSAAPIAPRPDLSPAGSTKEQKDQHDRAVVREIVEGLERDGMKVALSADGLSYRVGDSPRWLKPVQVG